MSRSVSVPSGAAWVAYLMLPESEAPVDLVEAWEDLESDLKSDLQQEFPSLSGSDFWLGREDRVILENRHAYLGLSEYNGVVALWAVPKDDHRTGRLSEQWTRSIEKRVRNLALKGYKVLSSMGRCSNGEQVFSIAGEPGAVVTSKEGRLW